MSVIFVVNVVFFDGVLLSVKNVYSVCNMGFSVVVFFCFCDVVIAYVNVAFFVNIFILFGDVCIFV